MNADQANYIITHAGYFDDEEVKEALEWETEYSMIGRLSDNRRYTPDEIRKAAAVHDWLHNKLAIERGIRGLNGQDMRVYADEMER